MSLLWIICIFAAVLIVILPLVLQNTGTRNAPPVNAASLLSEPIPGLISRTFSAENRLLSLPCRTYNVPCLDDDTCAVLCNDYATLPSKCVDSICVLSSESEGVDVEVPEDTEQNCDTAIGEFAFLSYISGTGIAEWRCVNLYPQFADRFSFCEGGTWAPDARIRAPSYADCTCDPTSVRVIYEYPGLPSDQLPHCIDSQLYYQYENTYTKI